MTITTISSREFNQDASGAKRAAARGPVFITDRGKPAHVLLTYEDYQALLGEELSLAEALRQKEGGDFDFDPPRLGAISRPADLS
jgi:prevent-host-death family protein